MVQPLRCAAARGHADRRCPRARVATVRAATAATTTATARTMARRWTHGAAARTVGRHQFASTSMAVEGRVPCGETWDAAGAAARRAPRSVTSPAARPAVAETGRTARGDTLGAGRSLGVAAATATGEVTRAKLRERVVT